MNEVRYKDLGDSLLIKAFGFSPKLRIIDIFLTNPYFDFSREELVKELGMGKQTLYKNFKDLEELGIAKVSRRIGRAVMYKINREHPLVRRLDENQDGDNSDFVLINSLHCLFLFSLSLSHSLLLFPPLGKLANEFSACRLLQFSRLRQTSTYDPHLSQIGLPLRQIIPQASKPLSDLYSLHLGQ